MKQGFDCGQLATTTVGHREKFGFQKYFALGGPPRNCMEIIMFKIKHLIILAATATLLFSQSALAATIGTDSAGSYSHGESKGEGSKTKTMPHHISGGKSKAEGSGSKSYSHHGKSAGSSSKPGGHSSACPFTHLLHFQAELGLTEAQVAEIKRLRFEYSKQSIRNSAEHEIAHMEFDQLVHAEKVDAEAIRSVAAKIAESRTNKIMATAEAKIALLNLLTGEQRKKTHTMHSAHSSH